MWAVSREPATVKNSIHKTEKIGLTFIISVFLHAAGVEEHGKTIC